MLGDLLGIFLWYMWERIKHVIKTRVGSKNLTLNPNLWAWGVTYVTQLSDNTPFVELK